MSLNNLLKLGAVSLPKIEQAAAWLIENGPVIEHPALPAWILRALVKQNRVARLRRGVYAVPDAAGRLGLSPLAVGEIVEPGSVVSFYAALAYWNLTDQTPRRIGIVSRRRHSPIAFGPQTVVFVARPKVLKEMRYRTAKIEDRVVRVARPVQAFLDALSSATLGAAPAEMLTILARGLETSVFTTSGLRRAALTTGSVALARRLGLLLELATNAQDPRLLELARGSHAYLDFVGPEHAPTQHPVPRWLLRLPQTPDRLRIAAGVRAGGPEA